MRQSTHETHDIEIRCMGDVWRKWSRRFGTYLMERLGLIMGLVSYHLYRLNEMIHFW
jgi:hypothetical protein